jgi:hypothetical protein
MRFSLRSGRLLLALGVCAFVLAGCEEDVTAVLNTAYPFEVYGLLNPTADTQYVRVFPIEGRLNPSPGAPVDAVVTSTDLSTGQATAWSDSLVAYADGTHGYLFWAAFRPRGGQPYRLDVTRSDGARSSALVTVVRPPELSAPVVGTGVTQTVRLGGNGAHLRVLEVAYWIKYNWTVHADTMVSLPYRELVQVEGDAHRVDLLFDDDYLTLRRDLEHRGKYVRAYGVYPLEIWLRAMVTDAAWDPPGGIFDPEVLIEPGLLSNVENGFGFVGSGYVYERRLRLSEDELKAAGFEPYPPPFPS